MMKQKT